MATITIRNIPDSLMDKVRDLAHADLRSMNSEFLVLLTEGVSMHEIEASARKTIPKEVQLLLWQRLAGKWEDDRKTEEIMADIVEQRTIGRDIDL